MNEIRVRITAQEKGIYRISSEFGEKLAEVSGKFHHEAASPSDYPAVGDYCLALWPEDESRAIITMIYPRKSCFLRKAAGTAKEEQVVAANADYVLICMSLNQNYNLPRLERYLALTWDSGASPIILLTKRDLCPDWGQKVLQAEAVSPGTRVLAVSSLENSLQDIEALMQEGKTYALIGSSGVGKSTLINRLLGSEALQTQSIGNDDKGRHTTTHRELIRLKNGAYLMDTPGMRELGMWDAQEGIDTVFADIEELEHQCRFSDCTHTGEPGCAIEKALKDGRLDARRWASYCKLKQENAYAADGSSYLQAKKEKFKNIAKINRKNKR